MTPILADAHAIFADAHATFADAHAILAINTTVFGISFGVYTLAIVAVGLYSARFANDTNEDFFLAGRSLGGPVAALSASASSESGWVTLGLVGWAYGSGVSAYWIIPGCLLGFLFNWFVLAARMREASGRTGALTLADFFAYHFKERRPILRILTVVVILVAMVLYVAAQMAAAGKAFSASFARISFSQGVLIGAGIVLVYTVAGGFRAVCWTDFLQALLMVGTLVVFPIYLLAAEGGFGFIHAQLTTADPSLLSFMPAAAGPALIGFLFGSGALGINLGYPGQPHVLVRFMALSDPKSARIGGLISAVWATLVYFGAVTVGLMARAMTAAGEAWGPQLANDPDTGLVIAAMNMLPGMLAGIVLAAVLAAICSTADSQLVVAASGAANDLYGRLVSRGGNSNHPWINRLVVLLLGGAAAAMVIGQEGSEVKIYDYVLTYGWAVLGASFGPQVILCLLWRRASYAGCIAGMAAGFLTAVLWKVVFDNQITLGGESIEVYNLTLGFCVAMAVNVSVSLAARAEDRPVAAEPHR